MSYSENPSPYIEYQPIISGTTKTFILTHVTCGQRKNSFIYLAKENNQYFEYHIKYVLKEKFYVLCIYAKRFCSAGFLLKPKNLDHILRYEK